MFRIARAPSLFRARSTSARTSARVLARSSLDHSFSASESAVVGARVELEARKTANQCNG